MKLGEVIYGYRADHNLSMREFSRLCKLSPAQVYFMERGTNSHGKPFIPTTDSLIKVAAAMGITLTELLSVCDDSMAIRMNEGQISLGRQEVIEKIILATPEQFSQIKSFVDFVTKS